MIKIWRSDDDDSEYPFKMLVIKGEARQGKTRLLDELVYITPETISVNKILLTKKNQKVGGTRSELYVYNHLLDTVSHNSTNFLSPVANNPGDIYNGEGK